jgi:hypothetical protein
MSDMAIILLISKACPRWRRNLKSLFTREIVVISDENLGVSPFKRDLLSNDTTSSQTNFAGRSLKDKFGDPNLVRLVSVCQMKIRLLTVENLDYQNYFLGTPYKYELRRYQNTTPASTPLVYREDISELLNFIIQSYTKVKSWIRICNKWSGSATLVRIIPLSIFIYLFCTAIPKVTYLKWSSWL